MFVADSDILARLAGLLKKKQNELPAYWQQIVADAHVSAYGEIVARLMARGYLQSQIDSWDRGAEFELKISLWFALNDAAALHPLNDTQLKKLDRRDELDRVAIVSGRVYQTPQGTTGRVASDTNLGKTGRVGFGVQDTSGDTFTTGGFLPQLEPKNGRNPW